MARVVVVGAGIAGLTLAHRLVRDAPGLDVVVLEQSSRAGGLLRTERADGFLIEWGPNGFLDNAPLTLRMVDEAGLTADVVPSRDAARRRYLFHRGRLQAVPSSPAAMLTSRLLPVGAKLRVLMEPFGGRPPEGDESVHAFAARRLGRRVAEVFADPIVSGVFAGDARQLSLRAAFPRIWALEHEHGGLLWGMLARRRARGGSTKPAGLGRLVSFRGGMEQLPSAIAAGLGSRVRLNTAVAAVTPVTEGDARWRVSLTSGEFVDARDVVLGVGPEAAARIVAPLDAAASAAMASIPSAPMAVVVVGFETAALGAPLDGFGFLVPRGEGARVLGALWESSVFSERAPEGRALIRVMVGGATDRAAAQLSDEMLVALVREELDAIMGIQAPPVLTRVIRQPAGIPQYTRGHLERVARIETQLAGLPGLHVAGHGFRGVGVNACIEDASLLAARIAD